METGTLKNFLKKKIKASFTETNVWPYQKTTKLINESITCVYRQPTQYALSKTVSRELPEENH